MNFRDINFLKQIKFSFLYKVLAIIASFLMLRYMIEYLGAVQYGIWSVMLVFVNWILFFDFGVANGVKNTVAKSLSNNNFIEAKEYISTGYVALLIFSSLAYLIFFTVSFFVNWQIVFNISTLGNDYLQSTVLTILFLILLNFVFSIITAVFNATQNAALIVLNQLLSQLIALVAVIILKVFTSSSLIYMAFGYGTSLLLSNIFLSIWFYRKNLNLVPSFKYYQKEKIKPILSLGMKFFFLQLIILFILSSDKMIITQLLGSSYVTRYDVLFKYFSVLTTIHGIINTPLWSMYTEAYNKNDHQWIENTLWRMTKLMIIYILIAILMYFSGSLLIKFWIGKVDLGLTDENYIYMAVMIIFLIWFSIFAYFTNGIEKTNIQLVTGFFGAIVNIPLSIYFVKYLDMGLNGVLLATIVSLSFFCVTGPVQAINEIKKMKLLEDI